MVGPNGVPGSFSAWSLHECHGAAVAGQGRGALRGPMSWLPVEGCSRPRPGRGEDAGACPAAGIMAVSLR